MSFKLKKRNDVAYDDPESLFRDLRSRKVEGLLSQQADMLREYLKLVDESDIALELPTGSGKTLVGLLIAEWRRQMSNRPSLFICPTKQLVHQVAEQAREKYGMNVVEFVGSARNYSPDEKSRFLNCDVVGVTTYSSLFNSNPFFKELGTVIFDDAHAAENYVSKCWSMEINSGDSDQRTLFSALLQLIEEFMPQHDRLSFQNDQDNPIDKQWVNHLPTPKFQKIKEGLISIVDEHHQDANLTYSWRMLRENLDACGFYYTNKKFLIRPLIAPTEQFSAFSDATQRVYMSATLGEGGDLERLFGSYRIKRIPAPSGWDKQGIGRRFFLFPMRKHSEEQAKEYAIDWIKRFPRALILTPSNSEATDFKSQVESQLNGGESDYQIFNSSELEQSKKSFVASPRGVAILANRYDGIDLNGEECRYLIVSGLPEATNLLERFLMSRMGANVMFRARVRTRIIQAVGRCTRSSTDRAFVVLLGEKAHNYFMAPDHRAKLHPELQAELQFGLDQSEESLTSIESNIEHFNLQDADWMGAEAHIQDERNGLVKSEESSSQVLEEIVNDEIQYCNSLWNHDFSTALSKAKDVVGKLGGPELKGYRAWWYYLAGNAAFLESSSNNSAEHGLEAMRLYSKAASALPTLAWLKQLGADQLEEEGAREERNFSEMLERLEQQFERLGTSTPKKLEQQFKLIRDGLVSGDSVQFENAQKILGGLLGYISRNSFADSAPDPWWVFDDSRGVVFEDYTETSTKDPRIGKNKVIQAKGHLDWLNHEHPDIQFSVIVCTTAETATADSSRFRENAYYVHVDTMIEFAEAALRVIRKLWDTYGQVNDASWRQGAIRVLVESEFTPDDVIKRLTSQPLLDVPVR